jgi:hypothetical protein
MDNSFLQWALTAIGALSGLGICAGGFGYLYKSFSKGAKEEKNDVITSADQIVDFWKQQVEGFREIIKELTGKMEKQKDDYNLQIKGLSNQLSEVRGQLSEKERQSKEYLEILQNRDPETKKFMEFMIQSIIDHTKTHKEIIRVLGEIHSMSTEEHNRNIKVVSTVTKEEHK